MGLLSRAAILAAHDLPHVDVDVAEWGGTVRVRSMTGTERDGWETLFLSARADGKPTTVENVRARLVALTVIDESEARLFTDEDVALLGQKSAAALDRVFAAALSLNRLSKGHVDELAKNSAGDPSADGSSASPNGSA